MTEHNQQELWHQSQKKLAKELEDYKAANECRLQQLEGYLPPNNYFQAKEVKSLEGNTHYSDADEYLREEGKAAGELIKSYIKDGVDLEHREIKSLQALSSQDVPETLVAPYLHTKIIDLVTQQSPIRALAKVTKINRGSLEIILDNEEVDVGWAAENQERPVTKHSTLAVKRIPTHELYARPVITKRFLDDAAIDVERWLVEKIARKIAVTENHAFIYGDGKDKPTGFMRYHFKENAADTNFAAITIKKDQLKNLGAIANQLVNICYSLQPNYHSGSVWLMSRKTLAYLRQVRDSITEISLWQPSLSSDMPSTILGYPVVIVDQLPDLQNCQDGQVPVIFGNLGLSYHIVDRQHMEVLRDPYSTKSCVEFYTTCRLGGDVVDFKGLVGLKCSA